MKRKPKNRNLFRILAGLVFLISGGIFLMIPFIPLGYILIAGGLFLLSPFIPFLNRVLFKLKARDKKNRVEKVEKEIENFEEKLNDRSR